MGKKFIDKKKSATFHLMYRDTYDPNYSADTPSGDRVFVRVDNNFPYSAADTFFSADDDSIFSDADDYFGGGGAAAGLPESVRREILELGFPDDGYYYLAHMREIKNNGGWSVYYHNSKTKLDDLSDDVKGPL